MPKHHQSVSAKGVNCRLTGRPGAQRHKGKNGKMSIIATKKIKDKCKKIIIIEKSDQILNYE